MSRLHVFVTQLTKNNSIVSYRKVTDAKPSTELIFAHYTEELHKV